ncbi:hypothetical protein AA0488_2490 [Kozakia baliensis NRIC 0488]|nr:hypothetical protein AA0488_2490 [Kozakia baliensis NRIC 0488]
MLFIEESFGTLAEINGRSFIRTTFVNTRLALKIRTQAIGMAIKKLFCIDVSIIKNDNNFY